MGLVWWCPVDERERETFDEPKMSLLRPSQAKPAHIPQRPSLTQSCPHFSWHQEERIEGVRFMDRIQSNPMKLTGSPFYSDSEPFNWLI